MSTDERKLVIAARRCHSAYTTLAVGGGLNERGCWWRGVGLSFGERSEMSTTSKSGGECGESLAIWGDVPR